MFGCTAWIGAPYPVVVPTTLTGSGPGAGTGSFSLGVLPASSVGATFVAQAIARDPGTTYGVVLSNGLELSIE